MRIVVKNCLPITLLCALAVMPLLCKEAVADDDAPVEGWVTTWSYSGPKGFSLSLHDSATGQSIPVIRMSPYIIRGDGILVKSGKLKATKLPDKHKYTIRCAGVFDMTCEIVKENHWNYKLVVTVRSLAEPFRYEPVYYINSDLIGGRFAEVDDDGNKILIAKEGLPAGLRFAALGSDGKEFGSIRLDSAIGEITCIIDKPMQLVDFRKVTWKALDNCHVLYNPFPIEAGKPLSMEIGFRITPDVAKIKRFTPSIKRGFAPKMAERFERVIAPMPKQIDWGEGTYTIRDGDTFRVNTDCGGYVIDRYKQLFHMTLAGKSESAGKNRYLVFSRSNKVALSVVDRAFAKRLSAVNSEEKYYLDVTPAGVAIVAETDQGLWNGVQTFLQLSRKGRWVDASIRMPCVRIADWPDFEKRMFYVRINKTPDMEWNRQYVDNLVLWKANSVLLFNHGAIAFKGVPSASESGGAPISEEAFEEFADFCRARNLEVIPYWNCGKIMANRRAKKRQYPVFDEIALLNGKISHYDISVPKAFEYNVRITDRMLELTGSKTIHLGLDESYDFAKHARAHKGEGALLLANYINRFTDHYSPKGITCMVYHDMLLGKKDAPNEYYKPANATGGSEKALELLRNKDKLIIDYWDYGESKSYPALKYFMDKGFRVFASDWFRKENIDYMSGDAKRYKLPRFATTFWSYASSSPARIWDLRGVPPRGRFPSHIFLPAVLYSMEKSWTSGPGDVNYDPVFETVVAFNERLGTRVSRETTTHIDLSKHCNASVCNGALEGFFDEFPTGETDFGGVSFQVASGADNRPSCISVKGEYTPTLPETVEDIPVQGTFKSLVFLHTYHADPKLSMNVDTGVRYQVAYADGETETIELVGDSTIMIDSPALTRFSAANTNLTVAWNGYNRKKETVSVWAYQWRNPRRTPIESISMLSDGGRKASVFLLGISGLK